MWVPQIAEINSLLLFCWLPYLYSKMEENIFQYFENISLPLCKEDRQYSIRFWWNISSDTLKPGQSCEHNTRYWKINIPNYSNKERKLISTT